MPPTAHAEERYERLPLAQIVPSKTNPRTHFDDARLAQLAASIREKGVVQPILVRPRAANGHAAGYEIIAGECRYRASKLAEQADIPALIRAYTDAQVLELQLVENIHRTDLTALEQSAGYRALIAQDPTKHTAATIAQRIGMSEAWVWDRLKLHDLIPAAKALLARGAIATGHAVLVSRQTPANQAKLIDPTEELLFVRGLDGAPAPAAGAKPDPYDGVKACSVRELEVAIADHIRFDVAQAAKAAPLDFGETAAQVAAAKAAAGKGRPKILAITFDHAARDDAKDPNERTYGYSAWRRADGTKLTTAADPYGKRMKDSPTCEYSALGVVVAGDQHYGESFQVCVNRDKCKTHFGPEIALREKNVKARARGESKAADRRETAATKKLAKEAAARAANEARWTVFGPALRTAVHAAAKKLPAKLPAALYAKVLAHHRLPAATKPADLATALLADALQQEFGAHMWHGNEAKFVLWAKALGVNVQACEPKAAAKPATKAKA